MTSDVQLATPAPDDAPQLAQLMRRCFTETFGHLYRPDDLAAFVETQTETRWHRELTDPDFAIRVAYTQAEPVGFAKLGPLTLPWSRTAPRSSCANSICWRRIRAPGWRSG